MVLTLVAVSTSDSPRHDPSGVPTAGSAAALRTWLRTNPEVVLVPLALLLFGVFSFILGNRISVDDGLGYDGVIYARMSKGFTELVETRAFDAYYVARLLPSGVVRLLLNLSGKPLANADIIAGFTMVNFVLLAAGTFVWSLTARHLGVSRSGLWLGYLAFIGNFQVMKMTSYYPVLIDTWAYVFAMFLVYAYVTDRTRLLLFVSLVGGFVQQTLPIIGLLLFVFPRPRSIEPDDRPGRSIPGVVLAALIAVVVLSVGWNTGVFGDTFKGRPNVLLALGLIGTVVYLQRGLGPLIAGSLLLTPRRLLARLSIGRLVVAIGAFVALSSSYSYLSANGGPGPELGIWYLSDWYRFSYSNVFGESAPLLFLVSHFVYFGPAVGVLVVCWRRVGRAVVRLGTGPTLIAGLAIALSIHSESRQLLAVFPIFVVALVLALDEYQISARVVAALAGIALVFSKVWLWIPDFSEDADLASWPAQAYFMNHGPWMSQAAFVIQGLAVAAALVLFWRVRQRTPLRGEAGDAATAGRTYR